MVVFTVKPSQIIILMIYTLPTYVLLYITIKVCILNYSYKNYLIISNHSTRILTYTQQVYGGNVMCYHIVYSQKFSKFSNLQPSSHPFSKIKSSKCVRKKNSIQNFLAKQYNMLYMHAHTSHFQKFSL